MNPRSVRIDAIESRRPVGLSIQQQCRSCADSQYLIIETGYPVLDPRRQDRTYHRSRFCRPKQE